MAEPTITPELIDLPAALVVAIAVAVPLDDIVTACAKTGEGDQSREWAVTDLIAKAVKAAMPVAVRAARVDELHTIANQLLGRPAKLPSVFTTPSVALVSEYGVLAEELRARARRLSAPTEEN